MKIIGERLRGLRESVRLLQAKLANRFLFFACLLDRERFRMTPEAAGVFC